MSAFLYCYQDKNLTKMWVNRAALQDIPKNNRK